MNNFALILALLGSAVLLALAALFFRRRARATDPRALAQALESVERRLRDELDRTRARLELVVRDSVREDGRRGHEAQAAYLREARQSQDTRLDRVEEVSRQLLGSLRHATGEMEAKLATAAKSSSESSARSALELQAAVTRVLGELRDAQARAFTGLEERVDRRLDTVRRETAAHLEQIRATVDEKLHATLETRLGESFRLVSERLEQLHKGFGEMQALASGVDDLRKVLGNVKTRGTFGEVQLGALLEQVLAPEQYATNVATIPGSSERVEFVVRLPGRGSGVVHLPIDAKFPLEDYRRLERAHEHSDLSGIEEARRALRLRLLTEAQSVREKYIAPPHTTDFGLMFLPTEGLYAEALRIVGLTEELQTRHRVVLAGPTTLYALLSSLQMGFRTLAIEKRSGEVWSLLSSVKTEFHRFGRSLDAVSKKLQEAGNKIAETSQRTRVMERALRDVEARPEADAAMPLLFGGDLIGEKGREPEMLSPAVEVARR